MAIAASSSIDPASNRAPFLSTQLGEVICIAVSAACYFLAIRFIELWPIALLAPLPMLAATFAAPSRKRAWLCALVPPFIGEFGLWSSESFFLSLPLFVAASAASALAIALLALIARMAARHWNNAAAALVFPIFSAALSFIFSLALYDGTWANPAYRMDGFTALLQIASTTGLWGIVFAMNLPASAIAFAWYRSESGKPWREATGAALALFGLVLLSGVTRLAMSKDKPTVRVAMIASDHEMKYSRTTDEGNAAELLTFYANLIPKAAAQGAQVVVLPEKIVGVTANDRSPLVRILSDAASSSKVWLVAGVNEIGQTPKINGAWVFMPNGALAGDYHKHYFVRGFEDGYRSGDRTYVIGARWGMMGVAICKDLDYPWFITSYGARDVTLMLVPAWDWEGPNAVMHERMSVVRGVENGFAMARSAKTGYVTAHDAYGRTLASSSTFDADPAMVIADVPLGPGPTFYSEYGDWFGWVCVIGSLVILMMVFILTPRSSRSR
jgi:apolipoprotein N-acyltransferase